MNWLQRTLSNAFTGEPSTKRHVVFIAAVVLCLVTLAIGAACTYWIACHGDLGTGAMGALTFSGGITAGLAGVAYRKPVGVSAPSAPGGAKPGVVPTLPGTDSVGGTLSTGSAP